MTQMDGNAAPSWYGLHSNPTGYTSGPRLTPVSFAKIFASQPWVFTAVMRMLWWASKPPLKVYQRDGEDKKRLRPEDHPVPKWLDSPWERGGTLDLVQALIGPTLVHGNSTVRVIDGAGSKFQFEPSDWRNLHPLQVFSDRISGWEIYEDNGATDTVPAQEMLHTAWWSPLGPIGVSPLQALGVTVMNEYEARRYTAATLKNMARPPSAITVDDKFLGFEPEKRKAAIDAVRDQVTNGFTGENAGRPAILPAGMKWDVIGHTAVEAELIDQRKLNREEIAACYLISPPMLGILDRATFNNIETLMAFSYRDSLGPVLVLIENVLNHQLLPLLGYGDGDIYCEFDLTAVLRGDPLKEIYSLRAAANSGILTVNEVRSILNRPPMDTPNADSLLIQANNMAPLETIGQTTEGDDS